jgi:uncharacterized protein YqkB
MGVGPKNDLLSIDIEPKNDFLNMRSLARYLSTLLLRVEFL